MYKLAAMTSRPREALIVAGISNHDAMAVTVNTKKDVGKRRLKRLA